MAHKYYVFIEPANSLCQLFHDSGWNGIGVPGTHLTGRAAQVFDIPDTVQPNGGAQLRISADGYQPLALRGILTYADTQYAYMQCDDFMLLAAPEVVTPEPPETDGPNSNAPLDIINWVYSWGTYSLATHEGCGQFTEACCDELHARNNQLWGHIKKNPGQNQYNGHAVDALQCLGGPEYGIWDIIHDSVSPNASPAYNNKGAAEPTLYCYPAGSCVSTRTVVVAKKK